MKNTIKTIVIIVLTIALTVSVAFNIFHTSNNSPTDTTFINEVPTCEVTTNLTDWEFAKAQIDSCDFYVDFDPADCANIGKDCLAILVNNKDFPVTYIDEVAKLNGYNGYVEMVMDLIDEELLFYIPSFTTYGYSEDGEPEEINYETTFAVEGTIVYNAAVEFGVIG